MVETRVSKKSILIVDDSHEMLTLYRMILELEGFQVFSSRGATEALALLTEIRRPDLILLDMKMEDMTGLEFLFSFKKNFPILSAEVPVVIMSGISEMPICDAVGFIRKPADHEKFVKAIHHFIKISPTAVNTKPSQQS